MEILVVIIILGILAALAIPQYTKTIEKGKAGEAINSLRLIFTGERIYRLEKRFYYPYFDGSESDTPDIQNFLNIYVEDEHFRYMVSAPGDGGSTFTCTATRRSDAPGGYAGTTITIDQDEGWGGTSPFRP